MALYAGIPTRVPAALIAGLRARCDVASRLMRATQWPVGARVRIVAGPFAALIATIEAVPESGRAWVLMEMMGQTVRAALAPEVLQRA